MTFEKTSTTNSSPLSSSIPLSPYLSQMTLMTFRSVSPLFYRHGDQIFNQTSQVRLLMPQLVHLTMLNDICYSPQFLGLVVPQKRSFRSSLSPLFSMTPLSYQTIFSYLLVGSFSMDLAHLRATFLSIFSYFHSFRQILSPQYHVLPIKLVVVIQMPCLLLLVRSNPIYFPFIIIKIFL